jgi:hypothetical protein
MKKIVFLIIVSFLLVFTGCNDDDEGYSLDNVWIGLGIVESTDSFRIVLDDGEVLVPVAYGGYYSGYGYDYSGNHQKIEAGDRVLVNFTILDDDANEEGEIETYYVRLNSAKKVLMKGILDITPENQDSIGNDPIVVQEYWISNNLLNLELKYWGKNEIHFINLVKQPGVLTSAGQPFELEIRHNSNDDEESIPYVALVSFKLDSLQVAGIDSVRFKVKSTDYDGKLHEFNGVYKYRENN